MYPSQEDVSGDSQNEPPFVRGSPSVMNTGSDSAVKGEETIRSDKKNDVNVIVFIVRFWCEKIKTIDINL